MSDPTKLKHYMNYPVCGYCTNAWDMIYGRKRMSTSPAQWVSYCRVGGCDPDVWDFIDEGTGWPPGWKIAPNGMPVRYKDMGKPLSIPKYDDRVYHKRASDDIKAPWRAITNRLRKESGLMKERRKGVTADDLNWEGEDEEEVETVEVDLDDPDMWE